mmetsp:Transcript_6816/g.12605  ORF Transcript_6816/g.12605 Transcript_6816/m.12605 type:complete len:256 (-) Transcript_6816:1148-1915(-)
MNVATYGDFVPAAATQWAVELTLEVMAEMVPKGPKLGVKTVHLIQGLVPQVVLNDLPRRYTVVLTCLESVRLNQLVYQLGHELYHVYADPRVIHPFAEVLACACSLAVLRKARKKCLASPQPSLRAYAEKFETYRANIVDNARSKLGLEINARLATWAQDFTMTCDDRNAQLAAASLFEEAMGTSNNWSVYCLACSAICSSDSSSTQLTPSGRRNWREDLDIKLWRASCISAVSCTVDDVKCVESLAIVFGLPKA